MAGMSLREKIAQMVVPFTASQKDPAHLARLKALIEQEKVGGFIISNGRLGDARELIDSLQSWSPVPLLISADFESGVAMRLRGGTDFPSNMALGATRNPALAYRMGRAVAEEGIALGVLQNYAPVADVNSNPRNPVINIRSYGEDPALVASMADAFVQGTQDAGMISTVKHFPGHGGTIVNSHHDLPVIDLDPARLDSLEIAPFRSAVEHGVLAVMIGHVSVPGIDSAGGIPSTLSRRIVDSLLRRALGFQGLVVTDAMNMKALTREYPAGLAAVLAVKAGSDILLMPVSESAAIDSVAAAVERREIPREAVDASVRKILETKERLRLSLPRASDTARIASPPRLEEHRRTAEEIARLSITVARNGEKMLPIAGTVSKRYYALALTPGGEREAAGLFIGELERRGIALRSAILGGDISRRGMRRILKSAARADELIVAVFTRLANGGNEVSLPEDQLALLDKIARMRKRVLFVSLGSPYVCSAFPSARAILLAYGEAPASIRAAASAIFGEFPPTGLLPVSIPGIAPFGAGESYPARDSITDAEVRAMAEEHDPMHRIDAVIESAIKEGTFPGAVILVQENGIRRYLRAYGRQTYDPSSPAMTTGTMFDLASVSKVISTTSCAMKLYEEGALKLDTAVAAYLPAFAQNGKEKITIRNLLLHNSGLAPFRLYYTFCRNAGELIDTLMRERLEYPTGTKTLYSDLGMITLGKVIERITGKGLDAYAGGTFFRPLGLRRTMYAPPESLRAQCAPTEVDHYWRKRLVQGTVHDEASALLDGVAGHAGLFSTAPEIAVMLQMLLDGGVYNGKRCLKPQTISLFTRRQGKESSRALGWDTPSAGGSSSGHYFSPNSFGHTGFTGTSVWVDPVKKIFIVFLTNRVYPTRENKKLIPFRAVIHDEVMKTLLGQ